MTLEALADTQIPFPLLPLVAHVFLVEAISIPSEKNPPYIIERALLVKLNNILSHITPFICVGISMLVKDVIQNMRF